MNRQSKSVFYSSEALLTKDKRTGFVAHPQDPEGQGDPSSKHTNPEMYAKVAARIRAGLPIANFIVIASDESRDGLYWVSGRDEFALMYDFFQTELDSANYLGNTSPITFLPACSDEEALQMIALYR